MNVNFPRTTGFLSLLGLFLAGCGSSALNGQSKRASPKAPSLVAQQQKFCQIILDGAYEVGRVHEQAGKEQNPIRHDALQKDEILAEDRVFDALYAFVGPSGEFTGWRGRASVERPNDEGRIRVGFGSDCQFHVALYLGMSTGNQNAIPLASPLGQTLATLDVSKDVIVSGLFLWAPKGGGYWPCQMQFGDRRHFLPGDCMPLPRLGQTGLSVRLTSIAQAR